MDPKKGVVTDCKSKLPAYAHLSMCSLKPKQCDIGSLWSFCYMNMMDEIMTTGNQLNLKPLPLLQVWRVGLRVPPVSSSLALSRDQPLPSEMPWNLSHQPSHQHRRHPGYKELLALEIPRDLRVVCQEIMKKTKYTFQFHRYQYLGHCLPT